MCKWDKNDECAKWFVEEMHRDINKLMRSTIHTQNIPCHKSNT